MNIVRLSLSIVLICLFLTPLAATAGAQISLTSDSSIAGHLTRLSFPAPYSYIRVTDVNSIVSRMRITNSKGSTAYFDGKPYVGQSIAMPPGDYIISCWSNFGNEIPQSVTVYLTDGNEPVQLVQSCNSDPVYTGLPVFPLYPYYSGHGRYPSRFNCHTIPHANPYYGNPCGNPYRNPCGNPYGIIYGFPCGAPCNYSNNCFNFGIQINTRVTIP